jgi:hypothetical protein
MSPSTATAISKPAKLGLAVHFVSGGAVAKVAAPIRLFL